MTATLVTEVEIERMLRAGRAPREVADELIEPLNNVIRVWNRIRKENGIGQGAALAPTPMPARPVAVSDALANGKPAFAPHELVARGLTSGEKRIERAAARAQAALDALRDLLDEHEAQAAARAEVAKLEKRLAEARAKLRGGGSKSKQAKASVATLDSKVVRAWARNNNVECPDVGRVPRRVVEAYWKATGGAA